MKGRVGLFWAIFVGGVLLDQAVKAWVRGAIPQGGSVRGLPWPGVFELTLTYNKGIAFGMFQGSGVLMAPIGLGIAAGCAIWAHRHPGETRFQHVTFGLLAAGAVGNLYDRVFHGRVTDMFWFRPINFPVFNVADACITLATVLLAIGWIRESGRPKPAASLPE